MKRNLLKKFEIIYPEFQNWSNVDQIQNWDDIKNHFRLLLLIGNSNWGDANIAQWNGKLKKKK